MYREAVKTVEDSEMEAILRRLNRLAITRIQQVVGTAKPLRYPSAPAIPTAASV